MLNLFDALTNLINAGLSEIRKELSWEKDRGIDPDSRLNNYINDKYGDPEIDAISRNSYFNFIADRARNLRELNYGLDSQLEVEWKDSHGTE